MCCLQGCSLSISSQLQFSCSWPWYQRRASLLLQNCPFFHLHALCSLPSTHNTGVLLKFWSSEPFNSVCVCTTHVFLWDREREGERQRQRETSESSHFLSCAIQLPSSQHKRYWYNGMGQRDIPALWRHQKYIQWCYPQVRGCMWDGWVTHFLKDFTKPVTNFTKYLQLYLPSMCSLFKFQDGGKLSSPILFRNWKR